MGARSILLGWSIFADWISLFREIYQQSNEADTDCKAAVTLLAQINKILAVFFEKRVLSKMGVPDDWSLAFVKALFSTTFVLSMHQYT